MKKKAKTYRKKASGKKPASTNLADSLYMSPVHDPAHSAGHRKMNIKENARTEKRGPNNRMTQADKIQRTSATNRRIITGAALGKTGQIVFK